MCLKDYVLLCLLSKPCHDEAGLHGFLRRSNTTVLLWLLVFPPLQDKPLQYWSQVLAFRTLIKRVCKKIHIAYGYMNTRTKKFNLNSRRLSRLNSDPRSSAEIVQLVYVSDSQEGIFRKRTRTGFSYWQRGGKVKDPGILARIRGLVIPPAWEQVWICSQENGHLQVTGLDSRGRKQYKYHPRWNQLRNMTKFAHLYGFGNVLPLVRARLQQDLRQPGLPAAKVLALIVSILEQTSMRVGNSTYEKENGSYGLTTLLNRHVNFEQNKLRFLFSGKKSVKQDILLGNRKLVRIVKQCREIPGKELFQYYDGQNNKCSVDSGMVNEYIRQISGGDFTAKDFRTWTGSLHALRELSNREGEIAGTTRQKLVLEMLDKVAVALGNTRSVCRKYYVHPGLPELFLAGKLPAKEQWEALPGDPALLAEERALMHVLKNTSLELAAE